MALTEGNWISDVFLIVGWIAIQAGEENHISHKELPRIAYIKRGMWYMYILLKIFTVPITAWNLNKI